jgi:cobalt-zinc-cadmium efflux system membrane fusion protein
LDHQKAPSHFQKALAYLVLLFSAFPGFGDLTTLTVEAPLALQSTLTVETVVEASLDEVLHISGRVSVNENALAKIGPSISGRVIEVKADIGQTVSRGQVLAVMQSIQLSDTQASFLKAKSKVELKRLDVERYRKLYDEGITSLLRLKERESILAEKEIEMNTLADQLSIMGMHEDDIQQISRQKGFNSNAPITATINGSVIDRRISVGQIVEISDELFIVADLSEVWIEAELPERSAIPIEINTPTEIEIPALAHQKFKGRLSFIDSTEDPESRTIKIRVVLSNRDLRLKPEMLASLSIHKPSLPSLSIPANAVIRDQNQDYVFVPTDTHRYRLRNVVLDHEVNGRRRVVSGLSLGEKVVTTGNHQLNIVRLQSKAQ